MRRIRTNAGFSAIELLVVLAVSMVVLFAMLAVYSQGVTIKHHVQGTVDVQSNVRLAMDKLTRDLRMIGFAVPRAPEVGGSDSWAPAIFHARQDEIGYRADVDGGSAEIVCTPTASNSDCPLSKLRLDSILYYQNLNCDAPDGAPGGLRLVASRRDRSWQPFSCSGYTAGDGSISVSGVTDAFFRAGKSRVSTVEQVYYRYVPQAQAPYGTLWRHVRYGNTPDATFPPTGATWTAVAEHLSDFWIEYQDGNGATLAGFPLSAANRALVRKIVLFMEGYDQVGVDGRPQQIQVRSEVLVRNLAH
jgi:hypothetical protein